jgi:hypothetical protein
VLKSSVSEQAFVAAFALTALLLQSSSSQRHGLNRINFFSDSARVSLVVELRPWHCRH